MNVSFLISVEFLLLICC